MSHICLAHLLAKEGLRARTRQLLRRTRVMLRCACSLSPLGWLNVVQAKRRDLDSIQLGPSPFTSCGRIVTVHCCDQICALLHCRDHLQCLAQSPWQRHRKLIRHVWAPTTYELQFREGKLRQTSDLESSNLPRSKDATSSSWHRY